MSFKISIPENVGSGDLELLPNGLAVAVLDKIIAGKSKTNNPKLTFRYTIVEEMAEKMEDGSPTTGKVVLDTYSLVEKALFKLADVYKKVTKEKLPQGDFDDKAIESMMTDALCGSKWNVLLQQEIPGDGSSTEARTVIKKQDLISGPVG